MVRTLAVVAVAGMAASAGAQTIANWNTAGLAGNEPTLAPLTSATNVVASNVTRGSGITATTAGNSLSASGWNDLSPDDYFQFGFTVDAGFQVDLTSLVIGTRSSSTGPGSIGIFYSTDGFATSAQVATIAQPSAAFVNSSIDLSTLPNLGGTVAFRVVSLGGPSANGTTQAATGTFRITNFFNPADSGSFGFTGTVIPTPGTAGLMVIGGLIAARRRRN